MLKLSNLVCPSHALALFCALSLGLAGSVGAQPEGLSYTITPTYNVVQWDDEIGLEDAQLYGGRLGIGFGRLAALQGYYLTRPDVETRLGKLDLPGAGEPLTDRDLDISTYGVDVLLNLGTGRVVPFLRGGGGVLRFDPAEGDEIRQISVKAGAGLRLGFPRFQAELFAEDMAFRVDRFQLAEPPATGSHPPDPDADQIRHNLSLGAGLTLFLGGARDSELSETDRAMLARYRQGLSGLSIPIEPFVGRLDFSDELMLDKQDLVGLRTGFDFGRFFGLRGYYWRGMNDDFDDTVPIQSWGGEARFNLNSGQGAVPYLVTGVGQLDFMKNFFDEGQSVLDDKTMLILGAGLGFRLGDRLELDISARDHILSATDLDETSQPDDLLNNWMIGAAFRFSLGGASAQGQKPLFGQGEEPAPEPGLPLEALELEEELEEEVTEGGADSVSVEIAREIRRERRAGPELGGKKWLGRTPRERRMVAGYAGERMIMIPVPTEGEIYVRYGSPGGVNIEARNVIGESDTAGTPPAPPVPPVPPTMAPPAPQPPSHPAEAPAPDLETIRQVIRDELRRAGVVRETSEATPEGQWLEKETATPPEPQPERQSEPTVIVIEKVEGEESSGLKPVGFRVYTGVGLEDPQQFILGGRLDLGAVLGRTPFHLLPEVAVGLGDDVTTILGAVNVQLPLTNLGGAPQWSPYIYGGLGVLNVDAGGESETDLAVNFGVGMDARFGRWAPFLEYQGIKAFDANRLVIGLRFGS